MTTTPVTPYVGLDPVPDELRQAFDKWSNAEQRLTDLRHTFRGTRPLAYLSPKSKEALGTRMDKLGVNFPRLAVEALAERMTLSGLVVGEHSRVWDTFRHANGPELAELVHTDRLAYGSAYVTVWATEDGTPTLTGDSPFTMTHKSDPATGETLWAARRYTVAEDDHRLVLYTPERITTYRASYTGAGPHGYRLHERIDNPLDAVPVTPFVRRSSLADPATGAPVVDDLVDLSDAVAKVLADAMVTSEYYARPRRWATGLEIEEDDDGNPIDPFGETRLLQSESPETEFGQLPGSRLDGYHDLLATLTQQIGALSGLPPHYLGLHGDQPASADGIRAAEAQLTARARAEQRRVSSEWARVAWLLDAVADGVPAIPSRLRAARVSWESPETSTPAMQADAAAKLRGIGVPLESVLVTHLGYDETEAAQVAALAARYARKDDQ